MVLWQSPDTPVRSGFHVSSVLEPCALSSACLVSCWSVVFGSRHSCLEFRCRVGVRTLALHVLSLCVSVRSWVRSAALFCPRVFCCVAHSSCFYRLRAFMLYLVLCGTQLVYVIGCVLSCCHVLCEHVASVLVFCVPCALMSICLDPTHLVTGLLIHFPQLLSLVTLLICSLYNLLVFAVPCGFGAICGSLSFVVPCLALPCLATG